MQSPPLDPPVSDTAPTDRILTGYDQQHLITYVRLLDTDAKGRPARNGKYQPNYHQRSRRHFLDLEIKAGQ
jgi:hypothetical protein